MSTAKAQTCDLCKKMGLKPINKTNIMYFYTPAFGLLNYSVLSVNVMNPGLLMRIFPSRDVTNVLLMNSMVGSAFYIYNRPHLFKASNPMRLLYSGYNAIMFNFGSVLLWAVLRSAGPRSSCLATILGLITGATLVTVGRTCITFLDTKVESNKSV